MKKWRLLGAALLAAGFGIVSGCAGISKSSPVETAPSATASSAGLVLGISGELPKGGSIGSIDLTLNLPPGVTVKALGTGETMPDVVAALGGAKGALTVSKYTPAGAGPGTIRSAFVKLEGFGSGDFAEVQYQFTGNPPKASDFSINKLVITDVNSKILGGLTCTVKSR